MSVMTRGIIAQPYSLAMHSDYSRRQFYSHAQVLLAEHDSARKHWENESNNVQALMDEVARLKVEIAGLCTGYEAYEQINAGLKAEVEALRKSAPSKEVVWCSCGDGHAANSYGAGFMDANDGVCANCDAAMGQGEQS
ncbi:hypothetical protein HBO15_26410 [Pseudomonas sp. WS 5111]|uniref:hypothetical protein n=1 Tax=Pseudomonas sp. WS 5111 TaxID=2717493 RepID=UPI001475DD48|nr:hypothetical protein [Pseudomonas sp. WS 5111]NMX70891.1 hypothetical protein [Pseudomonas sp. WS 5111]